MCLNKFLCVRSNDNLEEFNKIKSVVKHKIKLDYNSSDYINKRIKSVIILQW